ncbi:MAG: sulfatase [Chloroflexi bacterium AL-W]|nr:sulfatase [Chloroflexi bacterium AL-N1]NOK66252.1 sulfatase [Chloroflexi bacterium AL-N10]NOK73132.1 sulfatase [Chloroflexi bacterium AL-N5]NOK80029.1 sulfatase [Chloroflexi bacterium AL-W]NOK88115.1 sulfatase [Chloroflexi bacterium AL-N15]
MRIVYIDIDSCRPDHLGCYGYQRRTSPVIDMLASQGVRFQNCHTSDAPCLPSRAALFSGRFGINNGVTCHLGPASQLRYAGRGHTHDPIRPMWMQCLQQNGWETVCFSGFGQRHLAWWFSIGFTHYFGNQLPGGSETAAEVNEKVIEWLRSNGTLDNWFLHINYWDVHHPYAVPLDYFERVQGMPGSTYPDATMITHDVETFYGPRTARDWWFETNWQNPQKGRTARMPRGNPDTFENYMGFVDGHDAGIAYVDERIGNILEELQRLGVHEETAIIISGDHGESIGELGMYFEHGNACEGTTHVPLIICWPGVTKAGQVIDSLLYQLDLAPTVLELLGLTIPSGWDGISYAGALRGETTQARDHLVMGAGIYSYQRAIRTQQYRLIRTMHSGLYPYDPLYLFDMSHDPCQTTNLAETHPTVVSELDHMLLEWLWHFTTGPAGVRDPFQEQLRIGVDPDLYCPRHIIEQRLMDLGRDDQLADLHHRRDQSPPLRPW